jgi:hypothetical protein
MHEHDLDLIAALADGSLDDESAARALVESCEVCRREHHDQLAALELLASVPPAAMTDIERASLHRDLWTELRKEPAAKTTSPWWYRGSYVAAALFVVVGLLGVINGGFVLGGADSAATTVAEARDASAGEAPMELYGQQSDDGGAESADTFSTTTAAGAAATSLPYPFAEMAESTREKHQDGDLAYQSSSVPENIEECLARLGLEDLDVVEILELDQRYVALMDEGESESVTFVAVDECTIAAVEG